MNHDRIYQRSGGIPSGPRKPAPFYSSGQAPGRGDECDPAWVNEPAPDPKMRAAAGEVLFWRKVAERWAMGAAWQLCPLCRRYGGCSQCIEGFAETGAFRYSQEEARQRLAAALAALAFATFVAELIRASEVQRAWERLEAGARSQDARGGVYRGGEALGGG